VAMTTEDKDVIEDLRHQVFHNQQMEKERTLSDKKYADKPSFLLVQKIVFGAIAIILVTVTGWVLSLVVR
jgi:hypothetical protein